MERYGLEPRRSHLLDGLCNPHCKVLTLDSEVVHKEHMLSVKEIE